jgi:hypothetical protein
VEHAQHRIRVDFWGVSHFFEYELPKQAFECGSAWRLYLRPDDEPPANPEVCNNKEVQETISSVDEAGREVEKTSAIAAPTGETSPTFAALHCFEAHKQFFEAPGVESPVP